MYLIDPHGLLTLKNKTEDPNSKNYFKIKISKTVLTQRMLGDLFQLRF